MKRPLKKKSVPLYRSLAAIIENKITSGQYDPGSQLPTEDELTVQFSVSKIKVRNALMHLELDQLIVRKWGKGTFVAEKIPEKKQYIHTNLNDMTRALAQSVTKPIDIEIEITDPENRIVDPKTKFTTWNTDWAVTKSCGGFGIRNRCARTRPVDRDFDAANGQRRGLSGFPLHTQGARVCRGSQRCGHQDRAGCECQTGRNTDG